MNREGSTARTDAQASEQIAPAELREYSAKYEETIVWLNTQPNPNPRRLDTSWDHGQRGWRFHAVLGNDSESMQVVQGRRALCGLRPRHGWHIDLFMDGGDRCLRCEKKAGLPMSEQNSARARVVMGRISVDAK